MNSDDLRQILNEMLPKKTSLFCIKVFIKHWLTYKKNTSGEAQIEGKKEIKC